MTEARQFDSDQEASAWLADQSPGPRVGEADTARERLLDFALAAFKEDPNPMVSEHANKLVDAVEEAARKAAEAERDRYAAECERRAGEIIAAQNASINWAERARTAEAAVTRVHAVCTRLAPEQPDPLETAVAYSEGWNAALDAVQAALAAPARRTALDGTGEAS